MFFQVIREKSLYRRSISALKTQATGGKMESGDALTEQITQTYQLLVNLTALISQSFDGDSIPTTAQGQPHLPLKSVKDAIAEIGESLEVVQQLAEQVTQQNQSMLRMCQPIAARVKHKQTETALRVREQAIAASPIGIVIADAQQPDFPAIFINPAFEQHTGYSAAEILGRNFRFLQGDDRDQAEIAILRTALETGTSCTVTLRNYRKDGSLFWNELTLAPIFNTFGTITHIVGIQNDVSDRKEAEFALNMKAAELEKALSEIQQAQAHMLQAEKMSSLGQLVAGVAHEINNPVNFIHGNLTYAEEYTQSLLNLVNLYQETCPVPHLAIQRALQDLDLDYLKQDLPKLLSSMRTGTARIQSIVESLRNFSRMDESDLKSVDIHEGIESTLLILQHRLQEKSNIQVITKYASLPLVECYAGQLNQVFMSILVNAIDTLEASCLLTCDIVHTPEKQLTPHAPIIEIRTELVNPDWIEIAIADNGTGIPEAIQQRIFDPFFTTKPIGKGTGMGMSISYQIVTEKHRGKLTCHSTPGQGTKFTIQIPIRQSNTK
ncbi:MAG: ATP-binding protein [Oculatellaceae cyanobacterium Prado106]|nr:ATP-binding protein [Oculatellaceae cyanobacterium Prado106]